MKPGRVSSAERLPPPIVSAPSMTLTATPASARVIAAASPFGPEPTTIASGIPRRCIRICACAQAAPSFDPELNVTQPANTCPCGVMNVNDSSSA